MVKNYALDFSQISMRDLPRVGGKNASRGQLFNALKPKGVGVLDGFATTVEAYRRLLAENGLEEKLRTIFSDFDPEDVSQLAERGHAARASVLETPLPDELKQVVLEAYDRLSLRIGREPELAVRSSATHDACLINPFRCKLMHKKAGFEILTDEAHERWFTTQERFIAVFPGPDESGGGEMGFFVLENE